MARFWFKLRKFLAQKVLHTDDSPHAVALGAGLAMLVAFLPLVGLQTFIAVGLAALFRANKAICIPIVWITNPLTLVPIYGACLGLGRVVIDTPVAKHVAVLTEIEQQHNVSLLDPTFWQNLLHMLTQFGIELWVGCAIVGIVTGVAAYFMSRWGVVHYRERRRQKILRRNLLRVERQRAKTVSQGEPA